ncbi:DUF5681 domain-containing protein [Bradyrhizobium sp. JYMT SZCCT0428]|uniref:DUF5681 domain-containing protein n=1 Tax=Bradyrhizobium sp. JYMT SZCCT0428 TaxID=2807673 RepID=UPI001BAA32F8|nr:DUF5681 domain-containing protein [Bradyrhizobium sp. JYMT SZCCT0428]MBR1155190.1 hypothetical protein [Bradyrhizobium sp. JYMT SZCCT0428]
MAKREGKDYEIGYGRPPRRSQFSKGKSGNPNGRPKGARSLTDRFEKTLNERVTINENGSRRTIRKSDAVMKQLVNKAASGDFRSIKLILEMAGPLSERGRQAESEASYHEESTAQESLNRKLDELRERLLAGRPLFDDETEEK